MKKLLQDKRNLVILLLSILFIIKSFEGDVRFVFWVLSGVILTAGCDMLIKYLFLHQKPVFKSAVITGFIVSGILDYHQHWFILIIFSLLAILSKHIMRFRGKHIFNPANTGLLAASLFGMPLTWNIESNIYIIIAAGIYIAFSIRKLPHVLGFLIFFIGLFAAQGINPFLLISWFFVFIMLIEPKTSGFGKLRGFIFGSVAAIASFIIYKYFPQYDLFIGALFVANLFNPLLEKIKK
ncbi:MAG: RnfABCDGE type electron transport complex subunit D [bacterium]